MSNSGAVNRGKIREKVVQYVLFLVVSFQILTKKKEKKKKTEIKHGHILCNICIRTVITKQKGKIKKTKKKKN